MTRQKIRTPVRTARALGVSISFVVLLAACGGGGGGGGDVAAAPGGVEGVGSPTGPDIDYGEVHGGTEAVVISWAAPTQRVGGQALSMAELAGYRIYYGPPESKQAFVVQVEDPYRFESTVTELQVGTYYFAITAVDNQGRESSTSNELSATVS